MRFKLYLMLVILDLTFLGGQKVKAIEALRILLLRFREQGGTKQHQKKHVCTRSIQMF